MTPVRARQYGAKQGAVVTPHAPVGLTWAVVAYLVLSLVRPQDIWPAIGVVRPGLIVTVVLFFGWLLQCRPLVSPDAIARLSVAFLGAASLGVVFVTNTYWFFWTWISLSVAILTYVLLLPSLMQQGRVRVGIYRLLTICTLYLAIWAIFHGGKGPGSHIEDENDVALALIVGASFAFGLRKHMASRFFQWMSWVTAVVSVGAIVVTNSRGGFLGLAAAVLVLILTGRQVIKSLVLCALLGMVAWAIVPADYKSEVQSISDDGDRTRQDRIYSWGRAWALFLQNPLLGVGIGNVPWRIGAVEQSREAWELRQGRRAIGGRAMHSLPFTLLPETGLLGSTLYLSATWLATVSALRIVRRQRQLSPGPPNAREDEIQSLSQTILVGLAGFHVAGLFISVLYYPYGWLLLGLAVFVRNLDGSEDRPRSVSHGMSRLRRPEPKAEV